MKGLKILLILVLTTLLTNCSGGGESSVIIPVQPPTNTPVPPPNNDPQTQWQNLLNSAVDGSNTPGVVAAIGNGQQIWQLASGSKDTSTEAAIGIQDRLRIASMTKLMVATVVMKLAEEGKLLLDDPMSQYLSPSTLDGISHAEEITIRQLLNMTAGVTDYTELDAFNDAVDADPDKVWQHQEVLAYLKGMAADFIPGSSWRYSNSNYLLLDVIVAEATGSSLAEEMRRILFTPLAMESSYMEFREDSAANGTTLSVNGYEGDEDVTDINDGIGFGDGGVVSTAVDLTRFLDALFREKSLLSQASLDDMLTEVMEEEYGLGAEIYSTDQGPVWGHNGASSGFQGEMRYYPDKQLTIVILTNQIDSTVPEALLPQILVTID